MRILLVEDEKKYSEIIRNILERADYEVDVANTAIEAIEMFPDKDYKLIISDLHMDAMNGIQFLTFSKKIKPEVKTIILTGDPTVESELKAFEVEIDKYLRKDMHVDVLLKYIEQVLAMPIKNKRDVMLESPLNDLIVNEGRREVTQYGESVELRKKEFDILCYFLKNKNYAISRQEFIENIWEQPHEPVDGRVIDTHIKSLRKKLDLVSINSIRGFGYKWNE